MRNVPVLSVTIKLHILDGKTITGWCYWFFPKRKPK